MNEKALKTLEYYKITSKLSDLADSKYGKELCNNLLPFTDIEHIKHMQSQTTDAYMRLMKKGSPSFHGIHDIRPSLKRMSIGSSLNAKELLALCSNLDATLRIKAYGGYTGNNNEEGEDSLTEFLLGLEPLTTLNNEIKKCIISEDEIADEASSTLRSIRRSIRNTNSKIQGELSSILNSSRTRPMLQDNIITMRNGRYCLPIRSEYKNHFQGMVHDQSSTGSTLFIEPISVVKLNNDLRELSIEEQEEIVKILKDLSFLASEHIDELEYNFTTLSKLDFIFARGKLSKMMKGSEPEFNTRGHIHLKQARHPLIDPKVVVPIDMILGTDYTMLIITGPNTGGKTVSLKTVGLLTLMGQSGLHIPAFDGSMLSLFNEIYADIGDEQSIEQSLSTFSSHMTNIVSILDRADENSLVLFDELGAGTDPTEGAALAISILSHLHNKNITTLATTHYSELKIYALSTPGITNASCEFDIETLRPTYRLLIGIPGKSNAFAISSKLGLPDFIIEDASELIGQQDKSFEDLITNLESSRILLEKEKQEIAIYKNQVESLQKSLDKKSTSLETHRERIINDAKEEAATLLQNAKDYADESIRKYNKWLQSGEYIKEMEDARSSLREKIGTHNKNSRKKQEVRGKKTSLKEINIGDAVHVIPLGLDGVVSTLPNAKGDLQVQMGILNSMVNTKEIELLEQQTTKSPTHHKGKGDKFNISKTISIRPEINLIGKTVDESLPLLDKYLDDAYLAKLPQVRIIHGRGTGALKNAVHAHLKRVSYVKSFHLGEFNEGGNGVTIVIYK